MQILVRDRNNHPVKNAKVFIKWSDGTSTVYTDDSGSAEVTTNGHIVYTDIFGEKHYHEVNTRDVNAIRHQLR